jgi:phosphoglycerate kinase
VDLVDSSLLPTIDDLELGGRTALLRTDLNVPLDDGEVTDDFRIATALPTIGRLRGAGARVVVASHLGRPDGPDPRFSMVPVGAALARIGGFEVEVAADVAGDSARSLAADSRHEVVLLENTRFEAGETKNDPDLADRLAELGDCFVMDAFGSAHRAHASTVGVAQRLPSAAGPLLLDEVAAFDNLLTSPDRPFVVILGGAKVSSKIGVIERLVERVDRLLVGGAMCFTLLAARGVGVGESPVESDMLDRIGGILDAHGDRIVLPSDLVVADEFAAEAPHRVTSADDVPDDGVGLDIGPDTRRTFADHISSARTVFWNGPLGVAEWEAFAAGTREIAAAIGAGEAFSVVGGGDSVAALRALGLEGAVSHLSTGGGAGLELIENGTLPGIEALRRSEQ